MLVGFWVTFLIQHSAGLARHAAPRLRVRRRRTTWRRYNLISTIGSFILAARRAADGLQRRPQPQEAAPSPGPTRGRRNTLEWFTTSPPPVNNFDIVPRVRSVEPMKDIRRQIERQSRAPEQTPAGV